MICNIKNLVRNLGVFYKQNMTFAKEKKILYKILYAITIKYITK